MCVCSPQPAWVFGATNRHSELETWCHNGAFVGEWRHLGHAAWSPRCIPAQPHPPVVALTTKPSHGCRRSLAALAVCWWRSLLCMYNACWVTVLLQLPSL